jgi:hypothetical protein
VRRARAAIAGVGLLATALLSSLACAPAASAEVDTSPVVAVTGTNRALYAKHTSAATWTNLGGVLVAAPAVAVVNPQITQYIGIGTNSMLYQRTDTTDWRRLTTLEYKCTQIAMAVSPIDGTTVSGACTAGNGALYTFSFDGSAVTPTVATLTKATANDVVSGQAAVTYDGGEPVYLFNGVSYGDGNVWILDTTDLYQHDSVSTNGPGVSTPWQFEVYQHNDATLTIVGPDLSYSIPGRSIGNPALAAGIEGQSQLFVTGTNGSVYMTGLDGQEHTGWTRIPSATPFGPAASALLVN